MIDVKNLSVVYPDKTRALSDIGISIPEGENVALLGASGAGKTTLLLALAGVVPGDGEIIIDNIKMQNKTLPLLRQLVGLIFQNPDNQLFMPSIYEDIAFGLRNMGMPEEDADALITEYLDKLDIKHLRGKSALKISGGEKRLATLASVLVMQPKVMLFDEPTAFLDPRAKNKLLGILQKMPHTQLVATHDILFAKEFCERSIVLQKGQILADGPTKELFCNDSLMKEAGLI